MDLHADAAKAIADGNFDRAMDLLAPLVRAEPLNHRAWALLATLETLLDDPESAGVCQSNALDALQDEIEAAERLVADWKSEMAIEALAGLWPYVRQYRQWNGRIEVPFWEVFGDALVQQQQSVRAEICFGLALKLRRRLMPSDLTGLGGIFQRLWATAFQQNLHGRARRRIRTAIRLFRSGQASRQTLGNAYGSLATLESEMANRDEANRAFSAALECFGGEGTAELKAYLLAKRATLYLRERDYGRARSDFEAALEIARPLGGQVLFDVAVDAASYDHQIGEFLKDEEHLRAALARVDEAESTGLVSPKSYATRGVILRALKQFEPARRHFLAALAGYRSFEEPDLLSQAHVAWNLGGAIAGMGHHRRALRLIKWARPRLLAFYGADHPSLLNQQVTEAALLHRMGDTAGARSHLRHVLEMERLVLKRVVRKDIPLELVAHQRLSVEAFQAYAGLTLAALGECGAGDILDAALLTSGAARYAFAAASREDPQEQPPSDALDLPVGICLAVFLRIFTPVAPRDPSAWSTEWEGARVICVLHHKSVGTRLLALGDAGRFNRQMETWGRNILSGKAVSAPRGLTSAFQKIRSLCGNARLITMQCGLPAGIPFILCDPDFPAADIEGNWGSVTTAKSHTPGPALLVASGDFIRGSAGKIAGSAHILQELGRARGPDAVELYDGDATPDHIISALSRRPKRVHIIAHGDVAPGSTIDAFSGAALLFPNNNQNKRLTARHVATLDLRGVDLVILSACSTGTGQVLEGEGAASLASGFLQAGVQAVIASLWPVGNAETSTFMAQFYQVLDDFPTAEALHITQMRMRKSGLPVRDWAGWRLYARNLSAAVQALG
ncbi:CHAT domain-containing tetratricopeptide repeat protein [Asticcacaulis sp. SL142]|uniref:CHAT domain-containing tetratricopeptide repeat protein n=1 Tax=Asticcacaulis sp. SL142 TaxID=2995155 RepID=UPI00226C6916|nr:CHAT domain-containing tetratricopeptide repeat protein [Asticcacaulis sp. SL142]WAC49780.1 CHAT domain-containing tetratricopeptide repeat protein [Asticcacaulis sp. SL142]